MLDVRFVRKELDRVRAAMASRGMAAALDEFAGLDQEHRRELQKVEELKAARNKASEEIAKAKREGGDPSGRYEELRNLSDEIKGLDESVRLLEERMSAILFDIPNVPDESVPVGADETANVEVRRWGEPTSFGFEPKAHWDLGEELDIIDFQRGVKLSGARFSVLKGAGARLERALMNFMLDMHTVEHGYREVFPPILVNRDSMTGTGQLPKFEEDAFRCEPDDLFLVPTAEVPVTNLHRDEILSEADLPLKYTAYTPCFRREAGSYGRDTRGLIRQHQFNKVEMVRFSKPEDSYAELESLTADAEEVLQRLGLPYRVVALCTGDLGFSAAKTYDLEVWLPSYDGYKEISSCSNFEDFQARRMNIRYRHEESGKPRLVHTLNGSGLAIGRTAAAIMENYQRADGRITVPQALQPYMGCDLI